MQVLGEGFREAVRESFDHDRAVVVVLGLEACGQLVGAVDGDCERAYVIVLGPDVIGQAAVRP